VTDTTRADAAPGELAVRDLDWKMRHSLAEIVESAWEARRAASED
jgi:UDP-glucose 4-epimerase